ncbi:MAG: glycosyltransferase family A protein [bacterium]|nr:glycosyltransferase family A protein [bacterium]
MSRQPLVSVITTIYNREKYLRAAIESVLVQSYENWELLLVDDCSTDRSAEIAREYAQDSRVKVYVNSENLGDYCNRNHAASYAGGSYLKYLDADDLMAPIALETFVLQMSAFPDAQLAIVKDSNYPWVPPVYLSSIDAYRMHYLGRGLLSRSPAATFIAKDAFDAVGGFSGERHIGDTQLWLKIAARYPVVLVSPELVYWRAHGEQESKIPSPHRIFRQWEIQWEALINTDCPLKGKELIQAKRNTVRWFCLRVYALFRCKRFKDAAYLLHNVPLDTATLLSGLTGFSTPYSFIDVELQRIMTNPINWQFYPGAKTQCLEQVREKISGRTVNFSPWSK